jgi:hypothetical protein
MFKFDMKTTENFALFKSDTTKNVIFVETFDNECYEVRAGTISKSEFVAKFFRSEIGDLNKKLENIAKELNIN